MISGVQFFRRKAGKGQPELTRKMNEFVRETKNKLTLREFEVLNTSNLDYVGNFMGFNIKDEEKKLSIKIIFIEVGLIFLPNFPFSACTLLLFL